MIMHKRILAVFAAFVLAFVLCACDGGSFFGMCRDLFSSFPFAFRLTVYFVFGAILFLAIQRIIREVGK